MRWWVNNSNSEGAVTRVHLGLVVIFLAVTVAALAIGRLLPEAIPLPPSETDDAVAAVPLKQLYAVETELGEQAGAWDADRKLLAAMLRVVKTPADQAEVLRRSCGLEYNVVGPEAALPICVRAFNSSVLADTATHHRTGRRLAKVMSAGGMGEGALAVLDALPRAQAGLEAALTGWVRAETLRRLNRFPDALLSAKQAAQELDAAIDAGAAPPEYKAIADYELGRTLALTDPSADRATARTALNRALVLQRQLDAQNPEYAEYRLFLTKIFRELSRLPGDNGYAAHEADTLAAELSARDPQRWEYQGL